MAKKINITVQNKLVLGKRDMNIYHHSSRSAHMISFNSSIKLPLRPVIEDDYLHISIVSGPGQLENSSVVNLPAWADFEFSSQDNVSVTHSGGRTLLKIPPSLPLWQLKVTWTASSLKDLPVNHEDLVSVGDDYSRYQ
ncbi:MAG: hypothetical protein KAW12_05615 [Candidatus Aminicenantes bacterium]|nr:hypothetical protein [Candidatus Aminicenantes bacterium]